MLGSRTLETQFSRLLTMFKQLERRLTVEASDVGVQMVNVKLDFWRALALMPRTRGQ